MNKKILPYCFIASVVIGSSIYTMQKLGVQLPKLINNYVNDFLIVPIVLIPCLYVLRWSRANKSYTIPLGAVLYFCALYSVLFEYLLPKFHVRYTADFIDVGLYFIGGLIFYYLQQKE